MDTKMRPRGVRHFTFGQFMLYFVLTLFALACLLPMVLVVIASLSTEASILEKGFSFFPTEWTLDGYRYISTFGDQIIRAYGVTLFETVVGSLWTVFICSMFGYVLSRKTFRLRKFLTVFLLITMLFRGGGLSEFIIKSNYYQLRNNLLVLILPGVGAYTCFVMRTFIQSNVHESLIESAKLDGAGEFYIYTRIVLPLIKPVLAALGFMEAIGHWNQWQTSLLYMSNPKLATLQQILMKIQNSMDYFKQNMSLSPELAKVWATLPKTSTKMAIVVVTTGPIIIAYPFFQKYFIKGITLGSVKG